MARTYRMTVGLHLVNNLVSLLLRLGVPLNTVWLLTVPGRKTGNPQTVPITLVVREQQRWLVAPYGEVNWVRNLRAARQTGVLSRGRHHEQITVQELEAHDAAPVLKQYLQAISVVRPYFNVAPDAPLADFEAEAAKHPVFLITQSSHI